MSDEEARRVADPDDSEEEEAIDGVRLSERIGARMISSRVTPFYLLDSELMLAIGKYLKWQGPVHRDGSSRPDGGHAGAQTPVDR